MSVARQAGGWRRVTCGYTFLLSGYLLVTQALDPMNGLAY